MEGPSLVILREEIKPFIGRKVTLSSGVSKQIDPTSLSGKKLTKVFTWGKHLLLQFGPKTTIKIHFLMFGSYRIDDPKKGREPKLRLRFASHEVDFYSCSVQKLEKGSVEAYDFSVDPMSPQWNELKAVQALGGRSDSLVCDVLMDQEVFSGVGNIIKNEVLHRLRLHPLACVGSLSRSQHLVLVRATRRYCFEFLEWRKSSVLKKNWRIFRRRECADCGTPVLKQKTGELERISYFCTRCQPLSSAVPTRIGRAA